MIEHLIEKSRNGLLTPSETALLGRALNMTIEWLVVDNVDREVDRTTVLEWLMEELQ